MEPAVVEREEGRLERRTDALLEADASKASRLNSDPNPLGVEPVHDNLQKYQSQ